MHKPGIRQLRILILFGFLICTIASSGCAGLGDFEFDVCGGYRVFRSDANSVLVIPKVGGRTEGSYIPSKVVEVAWDERFVIAKQLGYTDFPGKGPMPDEAKAGYWILDTALKKAYGPYALDDFEQNKQALGVSSGIVLKSVQSYPKKQ